jgi:hypothetical protein
MQKTTKSKLAMRSASLLAVMLLVTLCLSLFDLTSAKAGGSRYFPETGHNVGTPFLEYWQNNGGLPVFGYPLTEAQDETDPETGKVFKSQWFQRNRFEYHPENTGTKYEILTGLLGKQWTKFRRERGESYFAPVPNPGVPSTVLLWFSETSHTLAGDFRNYWEKNGGLERFGFPITEEFQGYDPVHGKVYRVQWFERNRFEYHPENAGTPNAVLLGLLGDDLLNHRNESSLPDKTSWLKSHWPQDLKSLERYLKVNPGEAEAILMPDGKTIQGARLKPTKGINYASVPIGGIVFPKGQFDSFGSCTVNLGVTAVVRGMIKTEDEVEIFAWWDLYREGKPLPVQKCPSTVPLTKLAAPNEFQQGCAPVPNLAIEQGWSVYGVDNNWRDAFAVSFTELAVDPILPKGYEASSNTRIGIDNDYRVMDRTRGWSIRNACA